MILPDEIMQTLRKCPYCDLPAAIKYFLSWGEDGQRGFLGKNPDGCIMLMCPKCNKTIKYDPLGNKFLKEDETARSTVLFNLVFFAGVALIIYLVVKYVF